MHVLSELAETATIEIGQVAASAHQRNTPDPGVIVEACTIAEVFTGNVLDFLFQQTGIQSHPVGETLLKEAIDAAQKTWPERRTALKRHFAISISGSKEVQDFQALSNLRNSIVHGRTRLTRLQMGTATEALQLLDSYRRLFHTQTSGTTFRLTMRSVQEATVVARKFVVALDEEATTNYPRLLTASLYRSD